jgi:hypothetical protein
MESLEQALREHDFAVLCGTPDDPLVKRGEQLQAVRDNVVFELGLFMGALTRRRTFLLVPRSRDLALPSDLVGLTRVEYDSVRFAEGGREQLAALQTACFDLGKAIMEVWAAMRAAGEAATRSDSARVKLRAIRRIHGVIVDLRDLLVALPGNALESFGNESRFDSVKSVTAEKVTRLAASLEQDVAVANVAAEYAAMVGATRVAVQSLPYPKEFLVTNEELKDAAVERAARILAQLGTQSNPIKLISDEVANELQERAESIAHRYARWWTGSQDALRKATTGLHDALFRAALDTGEVATAALGPSTDA